MEHTADENLTDFIDTAYPCSLNPKDMLLYMSKCVKSLQKTDLVITKNINSIIKRIANSSDFFPPKYYISNFTNEVCFIIFKFLNLFLKYQSICFCHLNRIKKSINNFEKLISNYINDEIPIQVKFHDFASYVFEITDKRITTLEFKLKSLFFYVERLPNIIRKFNYCNNKELILEMKKIVSDADSQNDFIHQTTFDLLFESYVESNHELFCNFLKIINIDINFDLNSNDPNKYCLSMNHHIYSQNQSANSISTDFCFFMNILINKLKFIPNATVKFDHYNYKEANNSDDILITKEDTKKIDLKNFELLVQKVYQSILNSRSINYQMYVIIRCASLRFLCNKYYIIHNKEWLEEINDCYVQNCTEILTQTPHNLKISKEIISDDYYDIKFETILQGEDFREAIEQMSTIQFLNCPIDIWVGLKKSIDLAMIGARKLSKNKAFDPNIAFDDFFSIVLPVFASSQIMCPTALHQFLSLFKKMSKSNSMDIMSVSALALFGYIRSQVL